jgi:hypothetical protein
LARSNRQAAAIDDRPIDDRWRRAAHKVTAKRPE